MKIEMSHVCTVQYGGHWPSDTQHVASATEELFLNLFNFKQFKYKFKHPHVAND
jgi:hypothetical protein